MSYDEISYWKNRVKPNAPAADAPEFVKQHLRYIKKHLRNCKTVLDFGPGEGRLFAAYAGLNRVEGFDLTDIRKDSLISQARKYNLNFNLTVEEIVGCLPYSDKEYDAVVATEVLLHQRPENIDRVMLELVRVGKKVIVITWYEPDNDNKSKHCFNHDYYNICARLKLTMSDVKQAGKKLFFIYKEI